MVEDKCPTSSQKTAENTLSELALAMKTVSSDFQRLIRVISGMEREITRLHHLVEKLELQKQKQDHDPNHLGSPIQFKNKDSNQKENTIYTKSIKV